MAARRLVQSTALAVVLLLCVSGVSCATKRAENDIDDVMLALQSLKAGPLSTNNAFSAPGRSTAVLSADHEFEFDANAQDTFPIVAAAMDGPSSTATPEAAPVAQPAPAQTPQSTTPAAAATEQPQKSVASASEPQHAPQFPTEQAPGQSDSNSGLSIPTTTPNQQQQQATPTTPAPAPQEPAPVQQPTTTPIPATPAPQQPATATPATPAAPAPQQQQTVATPEPVPATAQPAAPQTPTSSTTPTPAAAPVATPAAPVSSSSSPAPTEEKKEEAEDPCKRVPGCMTCKPQPAAAKSAPFQTRRLKQFGELSRSVEEMTGRNGKLNGKIDIDMNTFIPSPYNAKDLPYCTACNTTAGYTDHGKGRCACAPGYGDSSPTGTCNRCPGGFFSLGGFRAVCVECEGVSFSNADHTACICASGWYGITSFATKQASCNQCPGSRPVSAEGARSASDCMTCPQGQRPNEIFSECVDINSIPEPVLLPETPVAAPPPGAPAPAPAPKLFNSTTFANTRKDWTITSRNVNNFTNPITDFFGSIMDSVVMGKNLTATAKQPGDLLYQVLTKEPSSTPLKMPTLPNVDLQNPAQLGAGVGAALSVVPAVLGTAATEGGKISDVVGSVVKAVETGSKAAEGTPSGSAWQEFVNGLAATAPKDDNGKSQLVDFAKGLGDLFGSASKVATKAVEQAASHSDNEMIKMAAGLLNAAKPDNAPEPQPAPAKPAGNDWASLLNGLMGQQAAPAPTPAPAPAPAPTPMDWTKLLSSLTKPTETPAPVVAPAPTPSSQDMQALLGGLLSGSGSSDSTSSAEITKLLASLTAKTKQQGTPEHIITAPSASLGGNAFTSLGQAPTISTSSRPASTGGTSKSANLNWQGQQQGQQQSSNGGGLQSLLSMLGNKTPTLSFANPSSTTGSSSSSTPASTTGSTFISVPSAPPKGSAAIKSGKLGPLARLQGRQHAWATGAEAN